MTILRPARSYRELNKWLTIAQFIKNFPHPQSLSRREKEEKPFSSREKGGESKARGPKAGKLCVIHLLNAQ